MLPPDADSLDSAARPARMARLAARITRRTTDLLIIAIVCGGLLTITRELCTTATHRSLSDDGDATPGPSGLAALHELGFPAAENASNLRMITAPDADSADRILVNLASGWLRDQPADVEQASPLAASSELAWRDWTLAAQDPHGGWRLRRSPDGPRRMVVGLLRDRREWRIACAGFVSPTPQGDWTATFVAGTFANVDVAPAADGQGGAPPAQPIGRRAASPRPLLPEPPAS